jgi:hypothetical protein
MNGYAFGFASPDGARKRILVVADSAEGARQIARRLNPLCSYEGSGDGILSQARAAGVGDNDGRVFDAAG